MTVRWRNHFQLKLMLHQQIKRSTKILISSFLYCSSLKFISINFNLEFVIMFEFLIDRNVSKLFERHRMSCVGVYELISWNIIKYKLHVFGHFYQFLYIDQCLTDKKVAINRVCHTAFHKFLASSILICWHFRPICLPFWYKHIRNTIFLYKLSYWTYTACVLVQHRFLSGIHFVNLVFKKH